MPTQEELTRIIVQGDYGQLDRTAQSLGNALNQVAKSQIRKIFGEVRRLEAEWEAAQSARQARPLPRLFMLKPRLAYQQQREKKLKPLVEVVHNMVDLVVQPKDAKEQDRRFRHFVDFMEALTAYHYVHARR